MTTEQGMEPITIYSTGWCPDCRRVKMFLKERGVQFREVNIEQDHEAEQIVLRATVGGRAEHSPEQIKASHSNGSARAFEGFRPGARKILPRSKSRIRTVASDRASNGCVRQTQNVDRCPVCWGACERSVTKRGSHGKAAGEDLCDAQVFVEKNDVRIGVGVEYPFFVLDAEEGGRIQGQHAQGVGE